MLLLNSAVWSLCHALACRGLKISQNAELRHKFNDHKTGFPVGSLLTFAAFTSVSLDDQVANGFGDHVLFNFTRVRGVRIRALSAVPQEAEVLVPPPSVFRIVTVAKFHGSLMVTLERVESPLTYLALPPAPPATAHVSSGGSAVTCPPAAAFPPPASAAGHVAAAEPEDPDVVALGQSLKALGVGTSAACSNFAKSLAHQGILTMERLKKMPVPQAKKALEIVKMTEFQIEAIMEALAPPPAAAPISPASFAPAPKPAIPTAQAASPAVPSHAKSGIVAPPTAQDKVRFSQLLLVELAKTLFHSPPSRFQAAAAARIKGQPSIHDAAESGNAGLVLDYIVADPAAVHAKTGRYVALCHFLKITQ